MYNYCLIYYLLLDNSICHETHKLYHFLSIMIRVHSFLDIFFWLGYKRGDCEGKHLTYSLITTKCGGSLNTPSAKKVSLIFTMWPNFYHFYLKPSCFFGNVNSFLIRNKITNISNQIVIFLGKLIWNNGLLYTNYIGLSHLVQISFGVTNLSQVEKPFKTYR